jgi:predicted TPR repeat methyltransferase
MPVSSSVHISDCLDHIIRLNPASVLDIGCGFGLWGFLCREYLDVWQERVQPEQWRVRIDGVELWEPYIQAHQRVLYNNIIIGDVCEVIDSLDRYDLIIAGDVIEHLDKDLGESVIERLYDKARLALLVNIPLTGNWDHPENHGNAGELHRSAWSAADFAPYAPRAREYRLGNGEYGSFFCPKDAPPAARVEGLLDQARRREAEGDTAGAAHALARALAIAPADEALASATADAHLRNGDRASAIAALRTALAARPASHFTRFALAQLLILDRHPDAAREIQTLLSNESLAPDFRAQVEALAARLSQ